MAIFSRVFVIAVVGTMLSGCGDDVTSTGTGGSGASSGQGGTGQGGGGASGGAGGQGAVGGGEVGGAGGQGGVGQTGCVNDPNLCPATWVCCSGVPYPDDGQCYPECTMLSDRSVKHDVVPVDSDAVLERLASLPIARWRYDAAPEDVHMGPMAQDFRAAFGLGRSERQISVVDANGTTMAAIQALYVRVEAMRRENDARAMENEALRAELADLRAEVARR